MSDYDVKKYEENENFKRILRSKFYSFPKISFLIYIILAISNMMLIAYLLTLNDNNDQNFFNFIIVWFLFIFYIILFSFNCILFLLDFPYKKFIILASIIIQSIVVFLCLLSQQLFEHIGYSDQLYYYVSHALNVTVTVFGFVPLYLVY
ncbi:hypothetical protein Catovirus_1_900 [Catovirus CTV1]|uniref:Uncharacterized protein n=1 Tax=Catovirus CTV1 TaxID=1977631 RepID=A0A1V0SAU7_9VIRU|nr:hypothetical protein Catovirus_1_900 [Catovirus CTV1]